MAFTSTAAGSSPLMNALIAKEMSLQNGKFVTPLQARTGMVNEVLPTVPLNNGSVSTQQNATKNAASTSVSTSEVTVKEAHKFFLLFVLIVVMIFAFAIIAGSSQEAGTLFIVFFVGLVMLQLLTHGVALGNFVNNL